MNENTPAEKILFKVNADINAAFSNGVASLIGEMAKAKAELANKTITLDAPKVGGQFISIDYVNRRVDILNNGWATLKHHWELSDKAGNEAGKIIRFIEEKAAALIEYYKTPQSK